MQRRRFLIFIIVFSMTAISPLVSLAQELKGALVVVSSDLVQIKLEGKQLPRVGDKVTIFESVPGVGLIPLAGQWAISAVSAQKIVIFSQTSSGTPRVGQLVVVDSLKPQVITSAAPGGDDIYQHGENYYKGLNGVQKDLGRAFDLFKRSADLGHAKGQFKVGYFFYLGKHVTKDVAQAALWFGKSAQQGYAPAQANLGAMYRNGDGVEQDDQLALKWLQKAASQGHAGGQNGLGSLYQTGQGVPQNDALAFEWIRKAALKGDSTGQYNLGLYYYSGWGIEKDQSEGTKWYRKAAEQGDIKGLRKMGAAYYWGHGVEQDYVQSASWYRQAAQKGDAPSQFALGRIYEKGKGVRRDNSAAYRWYRKAADQGDSDAQFEVAAAHYNGVGVAEDRHEAHRWYRKAAGQGDEYAQFAMGIYAEYGHSGVTKSREQALRWYRKSAKKGHEGAIDKIEELAPHSQNKSVSTGSMPSIAPIKESSLPSQAQGYVTMIQSSDGRVQQRGAKKLFRSEYKDHPEVLRAVEATLLREYSTRLRDGHHVDAMAWLCNLLGASRDQKFYSTLHEVANKCRNRKLKKYAQSNARKLR
ncbi:MAG: hypothetical protein BA870_10345 [Desulfuromonadales bacterium C00003094]|jgi:TPR repeat protein|nr:MAG: hypothetical protein BA870_10345 [Desulfuromonadales bacterium C00003094]OEU73096.1 MAG: hypothetical protein BA869_12205 [Desulfuromonadales bacterium C00003107]